MASSHIDETLPDELEEVCTEFHQRLQEAKQKLSALTENSREDVHEAIGDDLVDRANLDLTVAYAATSLYWCYLCTQGVSTSEHPVRHELDRIKKTMARAADVRKQLSGRSTTVNKSAAKRIVQSGIQTPGKEQQREKDKKARQQQEAQDRAMAKRRSRSSSPSSLRDASEKRRKT
ncbi:nuclear nucleic acid-binding protein C1D-like [Sycon ciliatum]|uniref:nuclear nucleic acid-binding protein C1D-like n=1 Tax=Sycon ciliatum TaxID=27933 RepID=UPI0020ADDED3|eukprot:scpid93163/ scgid31768/ Nuclear nucleic acid-binding protein C1D